MEYPFIAIAPRSTLTQSDKTRQGPIYEFNRTNYVYKQMADVKMWLLYNNTWNYLTECKKQLRFIDKSDIYIYVCVCVCKEDLTLNNLQSLICHKTQRNQIIYI